MPGDEWQKFAIYDCYMAICLHPGTNYCLWDEFGQSAEWNFEGSLDWHLNEYPYHDGVKLITDLNGCIRRSRHYKKQFSPEVRMDYSDHQNAVIFERSQVKDDVIVVCNFTQVIRENYRIGIPRKGN
jgi:1,4-alpha-glucan branching enzyme